MTRTTFVRVAMGALLVAGTFSVSGFTAPAGAAPQWTVVKSPSPAAPPIGQLSAVSCGSRTSCFAVGAGNSGPLIERWNGTGWGVVGSPSFGDQAATLNSISCASATRCIALGYRSTVTETSAQTAPLAERWDGRRWTVAPRPVGVPGHTIQLGGISCVSSTSCFAAGYSTSDTEPTEFDDFDFTSVIEHWNGTAWSRMPSPNPRGALISLLSGVSCANANRCFAVGDYIGNRSGGALILGWNGRRWAIVPGPASQNAAHSRPRYRLEPRADSVGISVVGGLSAVSCATAKSCFAVGSGGGSGALIERWNGTRWTNVPSPAPGGSQSSAQLNAVSCATATDCSAVGNAFTGSGIDGPGDDFGEGPLTEHWNGTAWSVVAQPTGARFSILTGVSCPVTRNCAAVGDSAFVQRWNGARWKIAPFTSHTSQSELLDISCLGPARCIAVGDASDGTTVHPLIERRVGSQWHVMPSPSPSGAVESILIGVSCTGATDCTAVGISLVPSGSDESFDLTETPLVEHWDGHAWSIVATPATDANAQAQLTSVSCATAANCSAVGVSETEDGATPLIEHWDGAAWSIVPAPRPAFGGLTGLSAVSCAGPLSCTAVGYYETFDGSSREVARTVVEHWNGTSWAIQPSPNVKGQAFSGLTAVSCPAPSNCTAVGLSQTIAGTNRRLLAEHWNGHKWVLVAAPTPRRSFGATFASVSCRGTSSCYAVGSYSSAATGRTLVEHWNGHGWSAVPSPNPASTTGAGLAGVSCASRTTCTAVGSYDANDGFFTLIERGP